MAKQLELQVIVLVSANQASKEQIVRLQWGVQQDITTICVWMGELQMVSLEIVVASAHMATQEIIVKYLSNALQVQMEFVVWMVVVQ